VQTGWSRHIDLYPTICDYLASSARVLQGVSLMAAVRARPLSAREVLPARPGTAAYEPQRAVRTTRHKYIRRWGDRRTPVLPNTDRRAQQGPAAVQTLGRSTRSPKSSCMTCCSTPTRPNNLLADPRYSDVLADLRIRLQLWMDETDDPLLAATSTRRPEWRSTFPTALGQRSTTASAETSRTSSV